MVKLRRQDVAVISIVVLVLLFLFFTYEKVEEEEHIPWQQEAYEKEFLALERSLASKQVEVLSESHYSDFFQNNTELLNQGDVLFFTSGDVVMANEIADRLLDWIDGGGNMVVGLSSEYGQSRFVNNALLQRLKISSHFLSEDDQEYCEDSTQEFPEDVYKGQKEIVSFETEQFGKLDVSLMANTYIKTEREDLISFSASAFSEGDSFCQNNFPHFVQLEYGQGLITLVTSVSLWNNFQIDNFDNALLAHFLFSDAKTLYIFEQKEVKRWYVVIAEQAPSFYWVLGCVILLCLWRAAVRFGAVYETPPVDPSFYHEHIRAAGEFYWANEQREKLLKQSRDIVLELANRKVKHGQPSKQRIIASLEQISGWDTDTLEQVLYTEHNDINVKTFTFVMQKLQQLRALL